MVKITAAEKVEPLSEEVYRQHFADLCHFSFKTVNSNTPEGGVRLADSDALPGLPYVSTRTLIGRIEIALDYIKNAGVTAKAVKHLRLAQTRDGEPVKVSAMAERDKLLDTYREVTEGRKEIGTDAVAPRLRQILVPKEGKYTALTPLVSAGFMQHLQDRLQPYRPQKDQPRRFPSLKQGFLGLGGSNPQNIGSLVRYMQRPLLFGSPQENPDIRKAYSVYYRGASLEMPRAAMENYRVWRQDLMVKNGGSMPTDFHLRAEEEERVLAIIRKVCARLEVLREFMEVNREWLPQGKLTSPTLSPLQQGIFEPRQRNSAWEEAIASTLADKLAFYRFKDEVTFNLSESARKDVALSVQRAKPWA